MIGGMGGISCFMDLIGDAEKKEMALAYKDILEIEGPELHNNVKMIESSQKKKVLSNKSAVELFLTPHKYGEKFIENNNKIRNFETRPQTRSKSKMINKAKIKFNYK